jgi:hypothetical protein
MTSQSKQYNTEGQVILSDSENNLQRAVYSLNETGNMIDFKISLNKAKVLGFIGSDHLRAKNNN